MMHRNSIEAFKERGRTGTAFCLRGQGDTDAVIFPRGIFRREFGEPANSDRCTGILNGRSQSERLAAGEQHCELLPATAEALYQAHKIEVLRQMAGGLAHRFNNLLQGALSAINLMHSRIHTVNSAELDFLIGHAFASVKGVGTLSERLFDFAKPQRLEPQAIDANATLVRMQDLLHCALLPGIELKFEFGDGPMSTICDIHQFEVTLLDLVLNARDAMPDGGVLTIKTEHADLASEQAGLFPGRYVSICVTDCGVGISPAALKQVFDPFYITKTTGHRTGLGLPLAKRFAERFQGHIALKSGLSQGTRVWLYLPCRDL